MRINQIARKEGKKEEKDWHNCHYRKIKELMSNGNLYKNKKSSMKPKMEAKEKGEITKIKNPEEKEDKYKNNNNNKIIPQSKNSKRKEVSKRMIALGMMKMKSHKEKEKAKRRRKRRKIKTEIEMGLMMKNLRKRKRRRERENRVMNKSKMKKWINKSRLSRNNKEEIRNKNQILSKMTAKKSQNQIKR